MTVLSISAALVALLVGFLFGWLIVAGRSSSRLALIGSDLERVSAEKAAAVRERERLESELVELRARLEIEQKSRVAAETEREAAQRAAVEQTRFVEEAKLQLVGSYAQLSQEALRGAIEQLTQTVKPHLDGNKGEIVSSLDKKKGEIEALLTPLREMIDRYQATVHQSEKLRLESHGGLQEQIRSLLEAQERTQREASRLATALKVPNVRGSWGENTLRQCVEMAGMSEVCDFDVQQSFEGEEGRRLRPDMIIRMANRRVIAVDSKAPIDAYINATEEGDEGRRKLLLDQHAKNLRRHIDQLGRKEYQASIGETLDFTVLFLGGEQFLSAALISDPAIFQFAVDRKIFLATPTVLLPLLRAVAAGWKAERQEESARETLAIGQELYERFVVVFDHISGVGGALDTAVRKYNEAVRSMESRLLPKARQFQAHVDSTRDLAELKQIDRQPLEAPTILIP
jgi:DNA recombination protein RmuC